MCAKRFFPAAAAVGMSCLLSGCLFQSDREPFGEKTYSAGQAQAVYAELSADMAQKEFTDQYGYNIKILPFILNEDVSDFDYDVYKTEEYSTLSVEGALETYLWYENRLYCKKDQAVTCRDMTWEELGFDTFAAERWYLAQQLLGRDDAELTYQYIPMSSAPYLLKAEYPDLELDGREIRFAELYFYMDEDGMYDGFSLQWQEERRHNVGISYFTYKGSASLQAERRIWNFGVDVGLTDEGLPSLSGQSEERERCRAVISAMDFDALACRSEYRENLRFPPLSQ